MACHPKEAAGGHQFENEGSAVRCSQPWLEEVLHAMQVEVGHLAARGVGLGPTEEGVAVGEEDEMLHVVAREEEEEEVVK